MSTGSAASVWFVQVGGVGVDLEEHIRGIKAYRGVGMRGEVVE